MVHDPRSDTGAACDHVGAVSGPKSLGLTSVIDREIAKTLDHQRRVLPDVRKTILESVDEQDDGATIYLRTVEACAGAGVVMTKRQFADFFLSVFEARQARFPRRLLFNPAGV